MVAFATRPAKVRRPRVFTPAEFERLEDSVAYELRDDGTLEERHMGMKSDWIASRVITRLNLHDADEERAFINGGGTGLQVFEGRPRRIPRADVVYILRRRLPQGQPQDGFLTIVPDLVSEVVSPGDNARDLNNKVHEYLDAGVRLVWVVYPDTRTVEVFGAGGHRATLGPDDTLTGGDVVPGFPVKVAELFGA